MLIVSLWIYSMLYIFMSLILFFEIIFEPYNISLLDAGEQIV